MRREELRLRDILEAADFILRVVAPLTEEDFLQNEIVQGAVLQRLIVIGEAAGHLPDHLRTRYPAVRWRAMRGMRDVAVHAYFNVDWRLVWTAALEEVPVMRQAIAGILAAEFPPPGTV
jgi:uncharacterized protein with HEPN domain